MQVDSAELSQLLPTVNRDTVFLLYIFVSSVERLRSYHWRIVYLGEDENTAPSSVSQKKGCKAINFSLHNFDNFVLCGEGSGGWLIASFVLCPLP